jgi:galactokinase
MIFLTAVTANLIWLNCQNHVENNFIGVNCGIMDQFAVAFGEKNKALMLNCDTLDYEAVDSNLGEYVLAIINTNKPRKLAESKYNERVEECQTALKALQQELNINYLCDIDSPNVRQIPAPDYRSNCA